MSAWWSRCKRRSVNGQLVLMGAEFTNVYARRYGSKRDVVAADRMAGEAKSAGIGRPRAA